MSKPEHGAYLDLQILDNGNLRISLTPEGQEELAPGGKEDGSDTHFIELLEDHLANGWELIDLEEVGALWGGLILANDFERDEQGELVHCARVYAYDRYAIDGYIEPLLEEGYMDWRVYE